ncbi:hypothetical protein OY671_003416 [Metschnikowia pulcherrima]|nr:hypothetical protein OY671_003416 [Metschnikowia pulcherrima]
MSRYSACPGPSLRRVPCPEPLPQPGETTTVAVKIRSKRLGKIRAPYYRVVVADSRTKRDGRVIEEIGKYHPTEEPSFIEITSDRAQYWLGVGAQPTEQVLALLKVTGDWQKFKGSPGAEGTLKVKGEKVDPTAAIEAAAADAEKALEHLVRGIVDNPDDVRVATKTSRRGDSLEVRVHPEDLGRVIGRGGRTARASRTVVGALATDGPARTDDAPRGATGKARPATGGPGLPASVAGGPACTVPSSTTRGVTTMESTVARVGKAHGSRGEVALDSRTDDPEERLAVGERSETRPADAGPSTVATVRVHQGRWLVGFEGVRDRTGAEASRGVELVVEAEASDEEDAWYPHELAGSRAEGTDGRVSGRLEGLEHSPAHDVLVSREPDGARTLVPFVRQIVPVVDVAGGRVVLDPPGGSLASDAEHSEVAAPSAGDAAGGPGSQDASTDGEA